MSKLNSLKTCLNSITITNNFSKGFYDDFKRKHDYLRISVIDKCNFKCKYCYPQTSKFIATPMSQLLGYQEILKLIDIFERHGDIKKIRLTGGEPLMRKDTIRIIDHITKHTGIKIVGLTTNGYYLDQKVGDLKEAGLTNLNISLDTLDPDKFSYITGQKLKVKTTKTIHTLNSTERFEKVYNTMLSCVQNKDFPVIKINCVIMKDFNETEIIDFVNLTKYHDISVRFIEYMPFLDNGWDRSVFIPYFQMIDMIKLSYPSLIKYEGSLAKETAKLYKIPGFIGTIGFITTMSQNFCGDCNRLRLTANGKLKNCIFGDNSLDLKSLLRNDTLKDDDFELTIVDHIKRFLKTKKEYHTENENRSQSLPMIQLGG
ncbi:unnamed protein product [Gordionus sp. m RMFG-2023]